MSADKTLDVKVKTDNGVTHSIVRMWEGELRGKAGHRITREALIAALGHDPQLAVHVAKITRAVPKGAIMFITESGSGTPADGPEITVKVRY
jgi:hypothetical protein